MLKFVLRRMLNKRWMILSLLIGNLLLVSITCTNPMYTRAVLQRMLISDFANDLEENNAYPTTVTVTASPPPANIEQISEADADDGDKIVGHIFGDNTTNVISQLASSTGVAAHDVSSVLDNMAPALMSSLSAATTAGQQQAAGAASPLEGLGDLSGLVGGLFGDAGESSGGGSLLGSLLGGGKALCGRR